MKIELMTKLEEELAEALKNLINAVTDIRGVDIELYKPNEFKQAYKVLSKLENLDNSQTG